MKKRFSEIDWCGVCGSTTPLACTDHKIDNQPAVQRELDAGTDVDITGVLLICRTTIDFRKGSGRLVGDGMVQSNAHPILHATADYEHAADLPRLRLRGVIGDPADPTGGFTDQQFLRPEAMA